MTTRPAGVAEPAARLYVGRVVHARLKPFAHRFAYDVFTLEIDLGRLDEADRQSALFRVNRGALVAFHEADHGDGAGDLETHALGLARDAGVAGAGGRVTLLCYPRILGYVFNPISVYFVRDAADALVCMIYEVRNTFGEKHTYVAPIRDGEMDARGVRQERDKLFYVSPFVDMAMRYRFRVRPPDEEVAIHILEVDAQGPLLAAAFHGRARPLTTASLLRTLARTPLLTFKVVGGIHLEAWRIWRKGGRLVDKPSPPAQPASYGDPGPYSKPDPAFPRSGA